MLVVFDPELRLRNSWIIVYGATEESQSIELNEKRASIMGTDGTRVDYAPRLYLKLTIR
jgi:hypothetical protein